MLRKALASFSSMQRPAARRFWSWLSGEKNLTYRGALVRVAREAPKLLGDSTSLVLDFLCKSQNLDGGFPDRAGRSDLYYTVFGLQALSALEAPIPSPTALVSYIEGFGDGEGLDFVHLCCLARCWALMGNAKWGRGAVAPRALFGRLESFRSLDGGYHPQPGALRGSAYAAFLAVGASQDLQIPIPDPSRVVESVASLATSDHGMVNEPGARIASTNATAAALAVLGYLRPIAISSKTGQWLLEQAHPLGGFRASPGAPLPDLLSTATALHCLAGLGFQLEEELREGCLDYLDSLWTNHGGFHGHWHDDALDIEYTFYGLVAVGILAEPSPLK